MTKKIISILLSAALILALLAACNTDPADPVEDPDAGQQENQGDVIVDKLTLVDNGVSDYVIVRGENASPSEITASEELRNYLKQISGVELSIVTDSAEAVEKEIIVGKTNREAEGDFDREELGKEGFVIKTTGSRLWLVGGELRGTLYSVYSFLEEYLGVRYYTHDVEKVPRLTTITLEPIEENKQIPVFYARLSDWQPRSPQWSVKQKINDNTHVDLSEELGGGVTYPGQNHSGEYVHSMQYFVNYYTYGESHPEYFAVDENGNIREDGQWTQVCLSNPDVLQLTIDGVRKMLEEHPNVNIISVSENDNRDTCQCEKCLQTDAEENGHAGTMLRFVNAVADNIKDDYPDVKIDALAYYATIDAPTITKPRDNVVVRLAPIEQCIIHSTKDCQEWFVSKYTGKSTYQTLTEWAAVGCELFIWDYSNNFDQSTLPYPSLYPFRDDVRMYADNNVKGIFYQGNGYSQSGEFGELRCYLLAKLFWDPYMSDEEFEYHINDFLEGYYGAGWEHIRAFIDNLMDHVKDNHVGTYPSEEAILDLNAVTDRSLPLPEEITLETFLNPESFNWEPYYEYYSKLPDETTEFISESFALFEAAEALAEDVAELARIQKAKIQLYTLEIGYLRKYATVVKTNLTQLRLNFFRENPDLKDQMVAAGNAMSPFTKSLTENIVVPKGSFLFDEMLKYWVGANPANTNLAYPKESANLTAIPEEWIPWH